MDEWEAYPAITGSPSLFLDALPLGGTILNLYIFPGEGWATGIDNKSMVAKSNPCNV